MSEKTQNLSHFLSAKYPIVKAQYPGEGRRRWRLRVADNFWNLSAQAKAEFGAAPPFEGEENADFFQDHDPLDELSGGAPGLGILVRTDYSNEEAWQDFCAKLQEAEAEFASESEPDAAQTEENEDEDSEDDEEMDEDHNADGKDTTPSPPPRIFHIINIPPFLSTSPTSPSSSQHPILTTASLTNASNLTILRLFNDVDVRPAPVPPAGTKRIKPPNRLVDHDGWQEVYNGKMIWVYDAKSNEDQCVRLVSQAGAMYGTATADSWRARVSHICELQVNLALGALTIDFGGLDRWDYDERVRNMEEAAFGLE